MKSKWIVGICVLAMQLLLLTGCWDSKDIQNQIYFNAIGVDFVDGKYVVYAQASDFAFVAKTETGKPTEEPQVWVGRGEGDTLYRALFDFYNTTQLRVYWGHITALVLSESLIKDGVQEVFDLVERYREIRANIWVYATKDSIKDIFSISSFFRLSPLYSILHEPKEIYSQHSYLSPLYLFRFMSNFSEKGQTTLVPTLTISKNQWEVSEKKHPMLSINGADVIQRGEYKGWLRLDQLIGIRWMSEETNSTLLTVKEDNRVLAELILRKPKINVKPYIINGEPKFKISIEIKGGINELNKTVSVKEVARNAEKAIKKEILDTYKEGLKRDADVLQLGYTLYKKNSKEWYEAYGRKHHKFPLNEESILDINVEVQIISTGKLKLRDGFNPKKR